MTYPVDCAFPAAPTLTILAAICNPDLSLVTKDISIAGDLGNGNYYAHLTPVDGQRGFIAFYTGTIGGGSNLSGVSVQCLVPLDPPIENADAKTSTRAAPGALMGLASGAITSAKFTINSITGGPGALAAINPLTMILEAMVAVFRWCYRPRDMPFTSGTTTNGFSNYYADDGVTPIGKQAAEDDGIATQTIGGVVSS